LTRAIEKLLYKISEILRTKAFQPLKKLRKNGLATWSRETIRDKHGSAQPKYTAWRNGFVSLELLSVTLSQIAWRSTGRQAPVKRCLARKTSHKFEIQFCPNYKPYGNCRRTFGASLGLTTTDLPRRRMRFGFFVPSKWRLPECIRMTLPVDVILKRFAAPR
jgi:hypothetical protein